MDTQLESIKARFDEFFDAYYKDSISDIITAFPDKRSLLVDTKVLSRYDPELANELIERPDDMVEAANESLKQKLQDSTNEGYELHVRFFGQNVNTPMVQDVGSKFIGKLILLDGLIVKRSEINPKVHVGFYRCTYCNATYKLRIDRDEVPELCPQCKRKSLKQDPGGVAVHKPAEDISAGSVRETQGQCTDMATGGMDRGRPGKHGDAGRPDRHYRNIAHTAKKEHTRKAGEEPLHDVPRYRVCGSQAEGIHRHSDKRSRRAGDKGAVEES